MAGFRRTLAEKIRLKSQPFGECIVWTGYKDVHGYGQIRLDGKWKKAHRVNYELMHGSIPFGLVIMHKCDNPSCINVNHLSAGTQKENILDMHAKNRANHARGENNEKSKLTAEQVIEIRKRFKSRSRIDGARSLARGFGVTHQSIIAIISRKTWTHI